MIEPDGTRCCKVMVDKRMNLARFKKCIEPIVGVPVEYFKIYRQYPNQDEEWSRFVYPHSFNFILTIFLCGLD